MRVFQNRIFDGLYDQESGATFSGMEFQQCDFQGCGLSFVRQPTLRSTVRNARLIDCSQRGCGISCAIIEDVLVNGFKNRGQPLQTFGAAFKHVTLRGKIDRLMISNDVLPSLSLDEKDRQREIEVFRNANAEYYRHVDWALDISQGEFKDLDIRGVPVHLIRRDPETQMVVTREKALEGHWRELEFKETLWHTWISHFLQTDELATVLVAPKQNRKFPFYLEDLRLLRDAGVAEPD